MTEAWPSPHPGIRKPDALRKARRHLPTGQWIEFRRRLDALTPLRQEPAGVGASLLVPVYQENEVNGIITELIST